jgi:hypothetical protein
MTSNYNPSHKCLESPKPNSDRLAFVAQLPIARDSRNWVVTQFENKGDRKIARHPERSRSSGGAKDLPPLNIVLPTIPPGTTTIGAAPLAAVFGEWAPRTHTAWRQPSPTMQSCAPASPPSVLH